MADRATAERIRTLDHAVRAAVHGGADPVPDLARAAERRGGGGASRVRISSEATTSTARVVRAGPRTARLVAPMSRPTRAETPAPPGRGPGIGSGVRVRRLCYVVVEQVAGPTVTLTVSPAAASR